METSNTVVSVIICTRNRGHRLRSTLDAIAKIKSDTLWEVLMIDNASTDETAAVIKAYDALGDKLRYAYADQIGLGAARDFAWRLAKGSILAFTDDDCYPAPNFVDAIIAAFDERPDVGLVGGRIMLFDTSDVEMAIDTRSEPMELPPHSYLETASYHGANMAIRKSALEKVGGFDAGLGAGTPFPCEDIDVAAAISWAGYVTRYDPSPVVYHHHGRKEVDLHPLWKGYDYGRGAYYAKYLMRPDSRSTYLKGWGKRILKHHSPWHFRQFVRELQAGRRFAISRKNTAFVIAALPLALAAIIFLIPTILARKAKRVLSRWLRVMLSTPTRE